MKEILQKQIDTLGSMIHEMSFSKSKKVYEQFTTLIEVRDTLVKLRDETTIQFKTLCLYPVWNCNKCTQPTNGKELILVVWNDGAVNFYHYDCLIELITRWKKDHPQNIETINQVVGDKALGIKKLII